MALLTALVTSSLMTSWAGSIRSSRPQAGRTLAMCWRAYEAAIGLADSSRQAGVMAGGEVMRPPARRSGVRRIRHRPGPGGRGYDPTGRSTRAYAGSR